MKLKKVTALILASLLTATALAGCGGTADVQEGAASTSDNQESVSDEKESVSVAGEDAEEAQQEGIVFPLEEKVSFTGLAGMNGDYILSDNLAWKTSLERANIDIELTNVLLADLAEKRSLVLASGDYPDIFYKASFSAADVNKYGMSGVFIPLEDLMRQYAPNFCKLMDETNGWPYITAGDGHVYSFPMQAEKIPKDAFWINKRWMDNLGLEEPTSYEELYEVLKAFKEQDANGNGDTDDEIPYIATADRLLLKLMEFQDYQLNSDTWMALMDGELTYALMDESYREFIAFATRLYQEGLVNRDCFTIKDTQMRNNGQVGDIYGAFCDHASFLAVGRDNDEDYVMLTPFTDGVFQVKDPYEAGTLAITDTCENPEIIVAWADYFYTEEGGILAWMGVEGESYEMYDDGTWGWMLNNGYGEDIGAVRGNTTLNAPNMPAIQPELWAKMSPKVDEDEVYLNSERRRIYAMGAPFPYLNYTDDETAALATLKTDIDAYVKEYFAKVVTGELSLEDSWDDYLDTMKQMGAEEMIAIYRAAYDRAYP